MTLEDTCEALIQKMHLRQVISERDKLRAQLEVAVEALEVIVKNDSYYKIHCYQALAKIKEMQG